MYCASADDGSAATAACAGLSASAGLPSAISQRAFVVSASVKFGLFATMASIRVYAAALSPFA